MTSLYKVLYLVRHGQTSGDVEDRFGGAYDDHLTLEGQSQSKKVAYQLQSIGAKALYSSSLKRAQETAGIIGKAAGLDSHVIPEFRERNRYGILSGMVRADAAIRYPDDVENIKDEAHIIQGSEMYSDFQERILLAFGDLQDKLSEQPSILVTHGGVIRFLFKELFNISSIEVGDCAYVKIIAHDGMFEIGDMQNVNLL